MYNYSGDDLLQVFSDLNVDLRHLNPNVIKAWFDTDCRHTKNVLNWLCSSLTKVNYISPLEKAEFNELKQHLDAKKCLEDLAKLSPNFSPVLDIDNNLEEILTIEDEIQMLEDENKTLDKLVRVYENIDSNLSLELTHKTSSEIHSKVECKKSQESCAILSERLDEVNTKSQEQLIEYDPEAHFINLIDIKEYQENIDNLNSLLIPMLEVDMTYLENSDDNFNDALETVRKRILHSRQIQLANNVEIEKLKEIYEYLNKSNITENIVSCHSLNSQSNIEVKEIYKKRLCEALDNIALKYADHYLLQTKVRYVQKELEEYQSESRHISKILESVRKFLSYYALTNLIQFEENKEIICARNLYQNSMEYINGDLYKCRFRTDQMSKIIKEYSTYLAGPDYVKMKLVTSIAKVLSSDGLDFKSALEAVGRFKSELNFLETQIFGINFNTEKQRTQNINEDIKILQQFLICGPTNRIVLTPMDLQIVWREIEEHLKEQSASVAAAVRIPQTARKNLTKAQNYIKQLYVSFLTNPANVKAILKQAEDDFNKRTAQYF